jgi:hypothetical protein
MRMSPLFDPHPVLGQMVAKIVMVITKLATKYRPNQIVKHLAAFLTLAMIMGELLTLSVDTLMQGCAGFGTATNLT